MRFRSEVVLAATENDPFTYLCHTIGVGTQQPKPSISPQIYHKSCLFLSPAKNSGQLFTLETLSRPFRSLCQTLVRSAHTNLFMHLLQGFGHIGHHSEMVDHCPSSRPWCLKDALPARTSQTWRVLASTVNESPNPSAQDETNHSVGWRVLIVCKVAKNPNGGPWQDAVSSQVRIQVWIFLRICHFFIVFFFLVFVRTNQALSLAHSNPHPRLCLWLDQHPTIQTPNLFKNLLAQIISSCFIVFFFFLYADRSPDSNTASCTA